MSTNQQTAGKRLGSGIGIAMALAACVVVTSAGTLPADAAQNHSSAYKLGLDWTRTIVSDPVDHTYFCLNAANNGVDCFTIIGYGSNSRNSLGAVVPGTYRSKSTHQRCLARQRASNSWTHPCGIFSQLYGLNGVCHQHTNRGQLSMHGSFMDPNSIVGGWLSMVAYGPYGLSYTGACLPASEAACVFTW